MYCLDVSSTDLLCCQKLHYLKYDSLSLILSLIRSQIRSHILSPWSLRWLIRCQSGSPPAPAARCLAGHRMRSYRRCEPHLLQTPCMTPETQGSKSSVINSHFSEALLKQLNGAVCVDIDDCSISVRSQTCHVITNTILSLSITWFIVSHLLVVFTFDNASVFLPCSSSCP